VIDKGKPDQSLGRKATGPRFLRHAFCDATKGPKIAGLPSRIVKQSCTSSKETSMKTYIVRVLVVVLLAFGFVVPAVAGGGNGAYKLGGAWVAKVESVFGGPPPAEGQWSYVVSADPSGRRAAGHGSIEAGFNVDLLFPGFEPIDTSSPILVNIVMTGRDTASFYAVWYGLKKLGPFDPVTNEIVMIGVVTGELKFVGPGKIHGSHNFELYRPDQDSDKDGFPDEGETPVHAFPATTVDTRLPMPE